MRTLLVDLLSPQSYQNAVAAHLQQIEQKLREIDAAFREAETNISDASVSARLRLMRDICASGLFDAEFYLDEYADVRDAGVDPFDHYVLTGDSEGRRPNRFFSPSEYRQLNMADVLPGRHALEHYINEGERSGLKASLTFDASAYLVANPAIAAFVDKPLFHYLKLGHAANLIAIITPPEDPLAPEAYRDAIARHLHQIELKLQEIDAALRVSEINVSDTSVSARLRLIRDILVSGLFDAKFYLNEYTDVRDAGVDPLEHYAEFGDSEGRRPNRFFLPSEYRQLNLADLPPGRHALEHYINEGERAGLKASLAFDASAYLTANPAIEAFVDKPLFHYLKLGRAANLDIRSIESFGGQKSANRSGLRIAANLGVKDEVEIIEGTIAHLRNIGVDLIMVCDMSSTDGTAEILEKYRSDDFWILTLTNEALSDRAGKENNWFYRNLEMCKSAPADWVIFLDADEYWIPASGNLKDCEAVAIADVLTVDRFNIPLSPEGPMMPSKLIPSCYDNLHLVTEAIPEFWQHLQEDPNTPWIMGKPEPKIMAKPTKIGGLTVGLHDVIEGTVSLRRVAPCDLFVAHLPLSTRSRFERKLKNITTFFEDEGIDVTAGKGDWRYKEDHTSWHWRRWAALAKEGLLPIEFDRNVFEADLLMKLRQKGIIRPADEIFRKGLDRWRT